MAHQRIMTATTQGTGQSLQARPATLRMKWQQQRERVPVIDFYQYRKGHGWREIYNWYDHKGHGFDFVLPQQLLDLAGVVTISSTHDSLFPPVVYCENSEKAITLCKAAPLGDAASYSAIAQASTAKEAKEAKARGRRVQNWNNER